MSEKITRKYNLPSRQPDETRATKKQREYLCHLTGMEEQEFENLGKWQASELIDQFKSGQKSGKTSKRFLLKAILGLVVFILVAGFIASVINPNTKSKETSGPKVKPITTSETAPEPDQPELDATEPSKPPTPPRITPPKVIDPSIVISIENLALPLKVVTLESISLLNEAGKETEVAANSTIEILNRGKLGSLTMKINGKDFVGNESRLANKAKFVKP